MPLKIAVQMDPIERIKIRGDSTFALLLEAQKRGHVISYYTTDKLALRDSKVVASVMGTTRIGWRRHSARRSVLSGIRLRCRGRC